MVKRTNRFKEFYPYYLQEHSDKRNILIHFIGANCFFILTILSIILWNPFLFLIGILIGYLLPHIGHVYFQKNKSMRASHPVFCVLGAFILYLDTWKQVLSRKKGTAVKYKKLLFFLFLFNFENAVAQNLGTLDWCSTIGKPLSSFKIPEDYGHRVFVQFHFDDSVTVLYVLQGKVYQVFSFQDKIFRVTRVTDGSLFEMSTTIDTTLVDRNVQERFEQYFFQTYKRKPDYSSASTSRMEFWEEFAFHCGASAEPRGKGIMYFEKKKTGISNESLRQYLLSFSLQDRLLGILLFDSNSHYGLASIFNKVKAASLDLRFSYRNSCEPGGPTSLKQILSEKP